MLFPIPLIWIQLLLQKDDLFLGALFTLLFQPVLVHFCGFLQSPIPLPSWTFTIKTGHSILEVLGCGVLGGLGFLILTQYSTQNFPTYVRTHEAEIAFQLQCFAEITRSFLCVCFQDSFLS